MTFFPHAVARNAFRSTRTVLLVASLAAAFLLSLTAPLHAQDSDGGRRWALAVGGTTQRIDTISRNGWAQGPSFTLAHLFGERIGGELNLKIFVTSTGFYTLRGAAADLGVVYRALGTEMFDLFLSGGGTAVVGSNSDGTPVHLGGAYIGARGHVRLGGGFGLFARSALRIYQTGELGPNVEGGLSFQW